VKRGDSIHDRQHPHDLFMELALEYEHPIGRGLRWFAYGGPVGEPALGPVAFPHRVSAMANPIAPIGHHWLDATHITFGAVTTGVRGGRRGGPVQVRLAGGRGISLQRPGAGRDRTDIDPAALDSYSARLSLTPTMPWCCVSAGRLNEAERHGSLPVTDLTRHGVHDTTAR
jgi:hypothetical protein